MLILERAHSARRTALAATLALLLLSADSGVAALRDFSLQHHTPYLRAAATDVDEFRSPSGKSSSSQAVLAPFESSQTFVDAAISDNAAVTTQFVLVEPISLSVTILCSTLTVIFNHMAAMNYARAAVMHGQYDREMQAILAETTDSLAAMSKTYAAVTGDIGRRLPEALAETTYSIVQTLPNDAVLKAAATVLDASANPVLKAFKALNPTTPLPFDVTQDSRLAPLRKAVEAKSHRDARIALTRLIQEDYAEAAGVRPPETTVDANGVERTVAGFRVINFAGDLTQPVKMLMQSAEAASGKPVDETMERLLRMRAAAIQSMAFSGDAKDLRQYSDQLKKVSLSKPLTAQVVAQGSAQNEATDLQETFSKWYGYSQVGNAKSLLQSTVNIAEAVHSSVLPASGAVATGMMSASQALGAAILSIIAFKGFMASREASKLETFEGGRNTGIAHERREADQRFQRAIMCRLMDNLRSSGKMLLGMPVSNILKGDIDLTPMLGLDAFSLDKDARTRISVTLFTRFCALYSSLQQRVNALFRENGECSAKLKGMTGAVDTVPTGTNTAFFHSIARFDTCDAGKQMECEQDIYDVQLVGNEEAVKFFKSIGYELVDDPEATWLHAANFRQVMFRGELNADINADLSVMEPATSKETVFSFKVPESRKLMVLRWKELKTQTAVSAVTSPEVRGAVLEHFNKLKALGFPVSDITISMRDKEGEDISFPDHGTQKDLQAAGYELLNLRTIPEKASDPAKAEVLKQATKDMASALSVKYTKEMLQKADVKKGRGESKPYTFIHIMRGNGISALKDIVLAPFIAMPDKAYNAKKVDLTETFVLELNEKAKKSTSLTVTAKPEQMMMPAGCKGSDEVQYHAQTLLTDGWMSILPGIKYRKHKVAENMEFGVHRFTLKCDPQPTFTTSIKTGPIGTAFWERLPVSPYPSNTEAPARAMKPYLWVNRRYVLPDFAKADDAQLPACPWQCADALKGVVLPPPIRPLVAIPDSEPSFKINGAVKA